MGCRLSFLGWRKRRPLPLADPECTPLLPDDQPVQPRPAPTSQEALDAQVVHPSQIGCSMSGKDPTDIDGIANENLKTVERGSTSSLHGPLKPNCLGSAPPGRPSALSFSPVARGKEQAKDNHNINPAQCQDPEEKFFLPWRFKKPDNAKR